MQTTSKPSRSHSPIGSALRLLVALLLPTSWLGLLAAVSPAHAEFTRHVSLTADHLLLVDLIGKVTVEAASGDQFEIDVSVRGRDAEPDKIEFSQEEGTDGYLWIRFPTEHERNYVYPALGHSSSSFDAPRGPAESGTKGVWSRMGRNRQIHVRGSGRGLELWADVTVRVPSGKELEVRHGAGHVAASGTTGRLLLDTSVGPVEVDGIRGDVSIDTGSGEVRAARCEGDLVIDTGSGEVSVEAGELGRLAIDTGSGGVQAEGIACHDLHVDTGSGSVRIALTRMGEGKFLIDTGSGTIDLLLPSVRNADIHADTGSGDIRVDLSDAKILEKSDGELALRVGTGGSKVDLDTGSGSIHIGE